MLAQIFSVSSNQDDLGSILHTFSFRTNLKLYDISITPKIIDKVITVLGSSKVDFMLVVVLKDC